MTIETHYRLGNPPVWSWIFMVPIAIGYVIVLCAVAAAVWVYGAFQHGHD